MFQTIALSRPNTGLCLSAHIFFIETDPNFQSMSLFAYVFLINEDDFQSFIFIYNYVLFKHIEYTNLAIYELNIKAYTNKL